VPRRPARARSWPATGAADGPGLAPSPYSQPGKSVRAAAAAAAAGPRRGASGFGAALRGTGPCPTRDHARENGPAGRNAWIHAAPVRPLAVRRDQPLTPHPPVDSVDNSTAASETDLPGVSWRGQSMPTPTRSDPSGGGCLREGFAKSVKIRARGSAPSRRLAQASSSSGESTSGTSSASVASRLPPSVSGSPPNVMPSRPRSTPSPSAPISSSAASSCSSVGGRV
jgi:hypothetical protein